MFKYLLKKQFCIKKYKVTLSNVDKFTTIQEINFVLCQINQITILRVNKSTKKNYCHIDINSELNEEELRIKLENFKVFGNKVKYRLKQLDTFETKDDDESEKELNSALTLKNNILTFLKTNFIKFIGCKHITDIFDQIDYEKCFEVKECKKRFLEYEYKFAYNDLYLKSKKKLDESQKYKLIPIKTYFDIAKDTGENDGKSKKSSEIFGENEKVMKKIFSTSLSIIDKLDLDLYNNDIHSGVWRNIQIKMFDDQILVNYMISQMKLDAIDLKYLKEIIKAEFNNIEKVDSIYIALNDKIKANTNNSSNFIFVGKKPFLSYVLPENKLNINILPFYSNVFENFNLINIKEIFGISVFDNVYDFSCLYIPHCNFIL